MGGLHEDLEVTNHAIKPIRFQREIAVRCDFADLFEVKSNRIIRRGRITTDWSHTRQHLRTVYRNGDFSRAVIISASQTCVYANGRLSFEVALEPGETRRACLLYTLEDGGKRVAAPRGCADDHPRSRHAETLKDWRHTVTSIRTSNEEYYRLFRRAIEDMAALRLPVEGTNSHAFLPAAGLPWFVAPFGRDSLIAALQNMVVRAEFSRGALDVLGSLQAQQEDPYRDAEPGKIFHEIRYGELAHFKLIPHTPYYGTADATRST